MDCMIRKASLFIMLAIKTLSRGVQAEYLSNCNDTAYCENLVGPGSECNKPDASCSNPYDRGCLVQKLPKWTKERVCNSDDPPEAKELGICRVSPFDYMELRIFSENWESAMFVTWILQIIMSELLDVPSSVETGTLDAQLNFYDPDNAFDYGTSSDLPALEVAARLGDCRLASRDRKTYEPCAHLAPEVWDTKSPWVQELVYNGTIEPPQNLGMLGQESWFVTKFSADRDPSLVSYLGLQGDQNRRKLAETFLRPTTWKDYCDFVSLDHCKFADTSAKRAPRDDDENDRMFVDGLYTGHFRATEQNDCDKYPTNCTGHIADYPAGWSSFVEAQAFHNNIYLQSDGDEPGSGGYSYSQLTEMWRAANATMSDLMMVWWKPEALYQTFIGTDAAFQEVILPTPTQECIEARLRPGSRDSDNWEERVGDPAGSCDESAKALEKLISGNLFELLRGPSVSEEVSNPGYEVLKLFTISELQIGEILTYWREKESPREAVCQWVSENVGYINSFVPNTYPRVLKPDTEGVLQYAAMILGVITIMLVLVTGFIVMKKRDESAIRAAQVDFLWLLLAGALMVAIGATIMGANSTVGSCIASIWFVNIGYTLEFVPLVVKIAAINRLMSAARRMRRVVLSRRTLFGRVAAISFAVVLYLLFWSIFDAPKPKIQYHLTNIVSAEGEIIVTYNYTCRSELDFWGFVAIAWNAVLLFCASILAFQTRTLKKDCNESQTLAVLIYSHSIFIIGLALVSQLQELQDALRSLIFTIDTIAVLIIYFFPKLFIISTDSTQVDRRRSSIHMGSFLHRIISSVTNVSHHAPDEGETTGAIQLASPPQVSDSESELDSTCISASSEQEVTSTIVLGEEGGIIRQESEARICPNCGQLEAQALIQPEQVLQEYYETKRTPQEEL